VAADGANVLNPGPLLGAALVAAAVMLTACGSTSVSPKSVAGAATKTSSLKSYRVQTTTTLKLGKRDVTFKGDGVFAPKGRRGRLSLDMSALNQISGAEGSPYNLGYAQFVLDGTSIYMRIPLLKQLNPSLKPWVKLDLGQAGRTRALDFGSFLQFGQGGDPTQALEYLRATGKLEKNGTDTVRGVSTTPYKGAVDLRKVADKAPENLRADLRKNVDRVIALSGSSTIPDEVWVDEQGYVRKERYTEKLELQGHKVDVEESVELFDFGTPVIAPVPPAADVSDFTAATTGSSS
jgi:hypothetical protein